MLVLKFDVKCGFKNLFVTEKDLEFPLPILQDAELANKIFKKDFNGLSSVSDDYLLSTYKDNPNKLITDYNLLDAIKFLVRVDFATSFLNSICFKNDLKPVLPGICNLKNIRLKTAGESARAFVENELNEYDYIKELFDCFCDSTDDNESDDSEDEPTGQA